MALQLLMTPSFRRFVKKMHIQDKAVLAIVADPGIGELKKGDLGNVQVYKFKMNKQEFLLAYRLQPNRTDPTALELLNMGSQENFYTELKRQPDL